MELSFEGFPEKINPKDVRLLDETGYSYIYIDDFEQAAQKILRNLLEI